MGVSINQNMTLCYEKAIDFIHVTVEDTRTCQACLLHMLGRHKNEQRKNYISIFLLNIIYYYEILLILLPLLHLFVHMLFIFQFFSML